MLDDVTKGFVHMDHAVITTLYYIFNSKDNFNFSICAMPLCFPSSPPLIATETKAHHGYSLTAHAIAWHQQDEVLFQANHSSMAGPGRISLKWRLQTCLN